MESSARENYLVTEVMTATPQKLQLMLIDAAIRSARQARKHWQDSNHEQAREGLIHAQEILGEMLAGLNREVAPELVNNLAGVYMFVFRALVEANHQHDEKKLDDALRILEIERETWQQVCGQLGSSKQEADETTASFVLQSDTSETAALPGAPHLPGITSTQDAMPTDSTGWGLSLDA